MIWDLDLADKSPAFGLPASWLPRVIGARQQPVEQTCHPVARETSAQRLQTPVLQVRTVDLGSGSATLDTILCTGSDRRIQLTSFVAKPDETRSRGVCGLTVAFRRR